MKNIKLMLIILISIGCFGPSEVEMSELTKIDGRMYFGTDDDPYTGIAIRFYDSDKNQIACELSYENGKMHGKTTCWYKSGEKMAEVFYKLGEKDGMDTMWYENGQKSSEKSWKDGKYDGVITYWDKNGKMTSKTRYKNDKEIAF